MSTSIPNNGSTSTTTDLQSVDQPSSSITPSNQHSPLPPTPVNSNPQPNSTPTPQPEHPIAGPSRKSPKPTLTNHVNPSPTPLPTGPSEDLQARMQAAQQAMQNTMQQQQRIKAAQNGESASSTSQQGGRVPTGPDWATLAASVGGVGNLPNLQGAEKEAMIKQVSHSFR